MSFRSGFKIATTVANERASEPTGAAFALRATAPKAERGVEERLPTVALAEVGAYRGVRGAKPPGVINEWLSAALRGDPVDWSSLGASSATLLATCDTLEVSELLHHQLTRNPQSPAWPVDVRAELARRARESTAWQLVRSAEIAAVLDVLGSFGVRPILFKG